MTRPALALTFLLTSSLATGCLYDLSFEGKRCDYQNPCPSGYTCTLGAEGEICTKGTPDGGSDDGDGSDGGDDPTCNTGESLCSPDLAGIQTCEDGSWDYEACQSGEYCLDTEQAAPECEPECADTAADCPGGTWSHPATSHCEARGDCDLPGEPRCNPDQDAVIECNPESGNDDIIAECAQGLEYCDPFDPSCKPYCDDDTPCASQPGTSCEPNSGKCVPMGLCDDVAACGAGEVCSDDPGTCIEEPGEPATIPGGQSPDMACYVGSPSEPADQPSTCDLQGRVVNFFNRQDLDDAAGLILRVHRRSDVLDGRLELPLQSVVATQDGQGATAYHLVGLPTNTQLVLEVQGRSDQPGFDYATMLTFGLFIRADDCGAGTFSYSAPAILDLNYNAYANPPNVMANAERGLLFGQLRDCDGSKILGGKGGVSMEADLVYYLDGSNLPDPDALHTNASGFFIAANALPIRGIAAARVFHQSVQVSLRDRPVRVFPGTASLVVFDEPQDPGEP